jgi:CobQ-like glutamine amidotransferase family enzyme
MSDGRLKLVLGHLYGDLLNLYADRGNIITLRRRCAWRGIDLEVRQIGIGEDLVPDELDLIFMGGGQDGDQRLMADDLFTRKAEPLQGALADGLPMLVVCGGYQLFGHYYQPAEGDKLPGLGLFDLHTVHFGAQAPRLIGNVVVEWQAFGAGAAAPLPQPTAGRSRPQASGLRSQDLGLRTSPIAARRRTLVGFENHGGRTYLGPGAQPLGRVLSGFGNNGQNRTEGAVVQNAFGTYLHGSLLPKNPHLADHLLQLALQRRYPGEMLAPLDDSLEWLAHQAALERYAPASSRDMAASG